MKLDSIRKFALSLEAVTEEPHYHFSWLRVREVARASYPEFIEKLLWDGRVVELRVSLKAVKARVVKSLVLDAYNTRVGKDAGV